MNEQIEILKNIQKVDAPPFLYTRIQERIRQQMADRISPQWAWSMGLTCLLIFSLNLSIVFSKEKKEVRENNLAKEMRLMPSNNIYDLDNE